jgi:hypothetical protein
MGMYNPPKGIHMKSLAVDQTFWIPVILGVPALACAAALVALLNNLSVFV